jgi:hypothetical protein
MSREDRMRRWLGIMTLAAALLAWATPATAAEDVVPSCYRHPRINLTPAPSERAVFVLVDQTTAFDRGLKQSIESNLRRLVRPGTTFTVASFSSVGPGLFPTIVSSGTLEPPLTPYQRLHSSAPVVRMVDRCLARQGPFGAHQAAEAVRGALGASAASFTNSEIMSSLRQLSWRVARSSARDRIVMIASDMLEHSTASSFYRNHTLRPLVVADELRNAARLHLFGDFRGARLWVIGAGLIPPQPGSQANRDIHSVNTLQAFWEAWFRQARARLIFFGRPSLVDPIE